MKLNASLAALLFLLVPAFASALVARDYRTTFDEHRAQVLACAGGTTGAFVLHMHILPDGSSADVRVESADNARLRTVGECVVRRIRSWRFTHSSSGAFPRYEVQLERDSFTMTRLPYQRERLPR